MTRFWLGTWQVTPSILPTYCSAEPLVALGADMLAVEIINEGSLFVVLFSAADKLGNPRALACRIGFANGAAACSYLHGGGFPLIDATITYQNGLLQVYCPVFLDQPGSMQYPDLLIAMDGIHFQQSTGPGVQLAAAYEQFQEAPDPGYPATGLLRTGVIWNQVRSQVLKLNAPKLDIRMVPTRSPNLRPISAGPLVLAQAWSGVIPSPPTAVLSPGPFTQTSRVDTYGEAAFAFGDLEVLGFRLALKNVEGWSDRLAELIAPLNLQPDGSADCGPGLGFRYVPAASTIQIELLRYGSMRLQTALPPLDDLDYQGQHELVVRVLVGKADDSDSYLRDPATFIPAIVVDNPWSKALGRDLQGFEKCMAEFCIKQGSNEKPLLPDGRIAPGQPPHPLRDIACVKLVERTSNAGMSISPTMLEISLPLDLDGSWDKFYDIHAHAPVGNITVAETRLRRSDFDAELVGNSFTRQAIRESLTRFLSVQVSPVDQRVLCQTLISSTCNVEDLGIAYPTSGAQLVIHSLASAPIGWQVLCKLLDIDPGDKESFSFQTLNWYRLKFSMDLKTHDGLPPTHP